PCMSTHCDFAPVHPLHGPDHDHDYGVPRRDDADQDKCLLGVINQAGERRGAMLRKREGFRRAYDGFDVAKVAAYGEADRARLLADPGIIRNRLKVEAAIHNAGVILRMRDSHGGFAAWLDAHHPLDKAGWVKLFKGTFRFTGGEITGEF